VVSSHVRDIEVPSWKPLLESCHVRNDGLPVAGLMISR
jgi:hypothetical protein